MKGPLLTQTFRGLTGNQPYHWRGERTNLLDFASTFRTLLGAATDIPDTNQAAFRDFLNSITFEPNPNENLDRTYPTNFAGGNAVLGLQSFQTQTVTHGLCTVCHLLPPGPGSANQITTADEDGVFQNFKAPQLRDIYQRMGQNKTAGATSVGGFGLMHDGQETSIISFLSRTNAFGPIPDGVKTNLSAFLQCFDNGTAPAVGYTRTINSSNLAENVITDDWTLLENQAAASNIDLVVKGTIGGKLHGLLYQPLTQNYLVDSTDVAPQTRQQLQTDRRILGMTEEAAAV